MLASSGRRRWLWPSLLAVALVVGLGLRLPAVPAGLPYLGYVDEGHVLHPARKLLVTGDWEPRDNNYPQLPVATVANTARLAAALAPAASRERWREELSRPGFAYDVVEPPELILVGRLLTVLLGLGVIALAGTYARLLAGEAAGAVAALAAALLPALVIRGAIVIVDVYAAFFVLAALAAAAAARDARQLGWLAVAGACCGLAAVCKYPGGLVGLALVSALLLTRWSWREKLRGVALAAAAGLLAAALAMPSLWRAPGEVWERFAFQARVYRRQAIGSYWQQAVRRAEWDLPFNGPELGWTFLVLAVAGLVLAIAARRWRPHGLAWCLFAVLFIALHAQFAFQAFRNLLPLTGLACVAVGVLAAWLGERLQRPVVVPAAVALLLGVLFLPGAAAFTAARFRLVDSRREAIDWLASTPRGAGAVLVAEAAFAPRELARLERPRLLPWPRAAQRLLRPRRSRFALVPALIRKDRRPLVDLATAQQLLARYEVRRTFGEEVARAGLGLYHGNRLRLYLLERRPDARRARSSATSAATGANSSSG